MDNNKNNPENRRPILSSTQDETMTLIKNTKENK